MSASEARNSCPLCGGRLKPGTSAVPFIFEGTVIVVKDVPAESCRSCHEPYVSGKVTDKLTKLLTRLKMLKNEVSIVSYADREAA
ncbi:MAG: type II toxin-antitoxin system MqsA family antitoxin [Chloroflexi bacterium]|nr:type II toxin-antitoxin system MqsA family antitoxin [Chloroflexota bacterium]MCI0848716.1 type II toxin-antitoxin system MqsA family antitoxin [Chloroflexota bacterium]MCI0901256.1 type II toxin-antitoxin system MqsA family antitoxin [Chloroflexota bacterium]